MNILVTGASGFVGAKLCEVLAQSGHVLRAASRSPHSVPACVTEKITVGDISAPVDWGPILSGIDAVVHAAARVHALRDSPENAHLYEETNARATQRLAEAAARVGVKRFIFLSSIKVNGEQSIDRGFTPSDTPNPQDAYGRSKLLGEESVLAASRGTAMQPAIVRPPLVYGSGVGANFLRLMRWVDNERPLPLGSVHNRRSLVSVWNLCDLLRRLLEGPLPMARVWLVSDFEDLSTPDLVRRIARAMRRKTRLLPVRVGLLRAAAQVLGKSAELDRLCQSLTVDVSATRTVLGWTPPLSVDESLARTVRWYVSEVGDRA